MQTSLKIFMFMSDSDGKMDGEEDPNLLETNGSKSVSGSVDKNKRHDSLMLYSSLDLTAKSSDIDMEENSTEVEQTPSLPAYRPTQRRRRRRGTLEGINEVGVGDRNKDEHVNSSKPDIRFQNSKTNGAVSRRSSMTSSMRQSVSSMLLFDSNEVMHLMGFDDESYK